MQRVIRYQTMDGVLHVNHTEAKRHAEKRYGDLLTRLAHRMRDMKYSECGDFIDSNLYDFRRLIELKADCDVPPNDEMEVE
jgi:hypothetical protein